MLNITLKNKLNEEDGVAIFEMIPITLIFILLINFSIGFFGAIHTGILNSIASKNYAMETFRHRADLVYFRNVTNGDKEVEYQKQEVRFHGITSEKNNQNLWVATSRNIGFFKGGDFVDENKSAKEHSAAEISKIKDEVRYTQAGVNPIWIKTAYGICLNSNCGK